MLKWKVHKPIDLLLDEMKDLASYLQDLKKMITGIVMIFFHDWLGHWITLIMPEELDEDGYARS